MFDVHYRNLSEMDSQLGEFLLNKGLGRIYSSPMKRALETSEIIGGIVKVPVFVEESLAEMELGPWTGLTELEVSQKYPQEFYLWNTCPGELKLPTPLASRLR